MRGWNPVGDKCLTAAKRDCFAFNCTQRPMRVDACSRHDWTQAEADASVLALRARLVDVPHDVCFAATC